MPAVQNRLSLLSTYVLSGEEKRTKAARVVSHTPLEKFLPVARFDDYFRATMKENH